MPDLQMVKCRNCGATNRVPAEQLQKGREAVCGRCKKPLAIGTDPITVTDGTFESLVEKSPLPVLLDMWAPWCGPCRLVTPIIDELAKEMAGRLRVGKMNVDENPATSERFAVRSIPALLVLKSGREVDRIVGAQPKSEILRRVERAMVSVAS
jgi:thioredoxin 2